MSDGERVERGYAEVLAQGVVTWLETYCDKIEIAGSIRREKETVGDIEIVCQPHNPIALGVMLDNLVENGTIHKALYRHVDAKRKETMRPRWGERLRCFVLSGVTVELAIGDSDNFGYLHWLRTGPADGNKYVVTRMMIEKSAMRFHEGYGWLCDYVGEHPTYSHKLSLPDELTVFDALGLPYINARWRCEQIYKAEWNGVQARYLLDALKVKKLEQKRLL